MEDRPSPVAEEVWQERLASMRPTIEKMVQRYAHALRDPEQMKLDIELAIWRSIPRFDEAQGWQAYANTIMRHALRREMAREGAHPEQFFGDILAHGLAYEGAEGSALIEDDLLDAFFQTHAAPTEWYVDAMEETIVFRVSIEEFLAMIARRFGENCRMLQVAEAMLSTATEADAAEKLRMNQRDLVRVLRTNLRSCLERFVKGGQL